MEPSAAPSRRPPSSRPKQPWRTYRSSVNPCLVASASTSASVPPEYSVSRPLSKSFTDHVRPLSPVRASMLFLSPLYLRIIDAPVVVVPGAATASWSADAVHHRVSRSAIVQANLSLRLRSAGLQQVHQDRGLRADRRLDRRFALRRPQRRMHPG